MSLSQAPEATATKRRRSHGPAARPLVYVLSSLSLRGRGGLWQFNSCSRKHEYTTAYSVLSVFPFRRTLDTLDALDALGARSGAFAGDNSGPGSPGTPLAPALGVHHTYCYY